MIIADTCSSSSSSISSNSNNSSTYGAGSLSVAVYSTADAQFSIVLTPSGKTVQLIGGMQQHGSTRYNVNYTIQLLMLVCFIRYMQSEHDFGERALQLCDVACTNPPIMC
jgi:hypothetical protein